MNAELAIVILLVGWAISVSALVRRLFVKLRLPALAGYILLGFTARAADSHVSFLPEAADHAIEFLAQIGVVVLLFQVGAESKVKKLLSQLGQASLIGLVSIVTAGLLGFAAAFWLLHLTWFTSLIVGTALIATSVGVPVSVWEEAGAIESKRGQLLLDVAELDDIAGVVFMATLFSLLPVITQDRGQSLALILAETTLRIAVTLIVYGGICILFAHFAERKVTRFLARCEGPAEETLTVIAIGMMIAAFAGLLGFSVAIGAFFAGLVFSKDPESIKSQTAFTVVYDLFTPFFFIGIGLKMHLSTLGPALVPALILVCVAFAGKFLGATLPALLRHDWRTSSLLGISMIPRAEIALIVSQRALALPEKALSNTVFSAIVLTCLATCIVPTVALKQLLNRWQ